MQSQDIANSDATPDNFQESESITVEAPEKTPKNNYFGYNYFERDINFFDNIPTPSDFKLGPGDEIVLSLWGETNSRESFLINKEGLIYYESIGFINLSNKTLKEAESILLKELSSIYSTLQDESSQTQLMLELGKLKSINVYFSGQVNNPGVHLIHPFSDIFSAIVQIGGINFDGSLRNIEIIRSNTVVAQIDFYSFFKSGNNDFSNIRILDSDIIHIPEVSTRAEIAGPVVNPGFFELIENETLSDLIDYAGGLEANAASNVIIDSIIPISERSSDDSALVSEIINIRDFSNTKINNGSYIKVTEISSFEIKAEVVGRVKFPGLYPATNTTLKDILDIAGGFDDPVFRKTIRDDKIVVLRKDENNFYGKEFEVDYNKSDSFEIIPGDKVLVYENSMYDNLFSISVTGAVNKRGSFQFKSGMTVGDAIALAEGFSPIANKEGIVITEIFSSINEQGEEIVQRNKVNNASLDFEPTEGSEINVLPLENVINVQGMFIRLV